LTFTRLSLTTPTRKHVRAVTLSAAAIAGIAMPTLASAATVGSTHTPAVATSAASAGTATATNASYTTTNSSAPASGSASGSGSAGSSTTSYTVVAGDTLYDIAQRTLGNGNDYHKLFHLNKDRSEPGGTTFTNPDMIDVGWTLLVPTTAATSTTTATTDSSTSPTPSSNTTQAATPSTTSTDSTGSSSSTSTDSTGSSSSTSTDSSTGSSTSTDTTSQSSSSTSYANDLDGWINQAISVLNAHGYTVSYNAIYQTAMNESSGNPDATNNWDSNAAAGTPSIGLMQMIQPTFDTYALPGYTDITNPVDNIISAVIYAQATYGGLDNVVAARCGGSCWYGY
jgi:LysM repeat protein